MRTFALLLVLANVAFFFWSHFVDVEAPAPNTVVSSPAAAPGLQLARERSSQSSSVTAEQQAALAAVSCIGIGPFANTAAFQQVSERLQQAGYGVTPHTESGEVFAGYWVSLTFATRGDAEQTLKSLREKGVTDAYILPEETPPVLSLGLFSEEARAEHRRDEIVRLGLQPQLQTRTHRGDIYWLDVNLKEPGEGLDPALIQPDSGGIVRLESRSCADAGLAGSADSASSAASSR